MKDRRLNRQACRGGGGLPQSGFSSLDSYRLVTIFPHGFLYFVECKFENRLISPSALSLFWRLLHMLNWWKKFFFSCWPIFCCGDFTCGPWCWSGKRLPLPSNAMVKFNSSRETRSISTSLLHLSSCWEPPTSSEQAQASLLDNERPHKKRIKTTQLLELRRPQPWKWGHLDLSPWLISIRPDGLPNWPTGLRQRIIACGCKPLNYNKR